MRAKWVGRQSFARRNAWVDNRRRARSDAPRIVCERHNPTILRENFRWWNDGDERCRTVFDIRNHNVTNTPQNRCLRFIRFADAKFRRGISAPQLFDPEAATRAQVIELNRRMREPFEEIEEEEAAAAALLRQQHRQEAKASAASQAIVARRPGGRRDLRCPGHVRMLRKPLGDRRLANADDLRNGRFPAYSARGSPYGHGSSPRGPQKLLHEIGRRLWLPQTRTVFRSPSRQRSQRLAFHPLIDILSL